MRHSARALLLALMMVAGTASLAAPAPASAAGARVAATQPLVVLTSGHAVRSRPSARARRVEFVQARRPLTRVRTVLPVLGRKLNRGRWLWLHVRLPGRPNGHTGWIRAAGTRRASTPWHVVLRRSTRRVTVYYLGRVQKRFRAVVGKRSTPTPRGRFFIEEAVALSSQDMGGPFALATSARSGVLQEFAGGPGQIALHGTDGLPGSLGSAVSHGCIRLRTRAITWMARRIGRGTPLTIRR